MSLKCKIGNWAVAIVCCASVLTGSPLRDAGLHYPEDHFPELDRLLRLATTDSARMELLSQQVREQEGEERVAASVRRMRLDANLRLIGAYEMRDDIDDRFRAAGNASIQAIKPIYHWDRLKNMEAIGQVRADLARIEFERGGAEHLRDIRQTYLFWMLANERVAILRQTISLAETLVDNERQLLEIGRSTQSTVLEMEARSLERQEQLASQERERARYSRQLAQLVSVPDIADTLTPGSFPEFDTLDLNSLEMLARRLRSMNVDRAPEVRFQAQMQEIERKRYAIASRNRYPRIDFVAGLFTDQLDAFDQDDFALRMQYFAGVQFSWNIFDGRRTVGEKMAAGARRRVHEIREDMAREQIDGETLEMVAEAELAIKKLEAQRTRARILSNRLALLEEQAERDLTTPLEQLEARLEYEDVRLRLAESRVQYSLALMGLASRHLPDPHMLLNNR